MYLIAGLGNPERKYANTRHNVGFDAAESLRREIGAGLSRVRFHAEISRGEIGGEPVIIARPLTYMNLSGNAIAEITSFYRIEPEHVIIFCDDVNLPLGHLRIRKAGSAGGHNGLKNIIERLGSDQFGRVRIGVGEKPEGWDLADHVLAHMNAEEQAVIAEAEKNAAKAAIVYITKGLNEAMNRYNTPRPPRPKKEKEAPRGDDAAGTDTEKENASV